MGMLCMWETWASKKSLPHVNNIIVDFRKWNTRRSADTEWKVANLWTRVICFCCREGFHIYWLCPFKKSELKPEER